MKEIEKILDRMEPGEALDQLAPALGKLLAHLDEEARVRYVARLVGENSEDKIASMVNL